MSTSVYLRLEKKQACKSFLFAGGNRAVTLAGTIALLSARMPYGETSSGGYCR